MESWNRVNGSDYRIWTHQGVGNLCTQQRGFSLAVATAPGAAPATSRYTRSHRKSHRCRVDILIGKTQIIDTGASGGNCLDKSVFNSLPVDKYRIISFKPSMCVGNINKTPVRVLGRILLERKRRFVYS